MPKTPERAAFGVFPQAGKRGQRKLTANEQLAQFLDERAMELPKFGDLDLEVPTAANRSMGSRMVERDVGLKRQADKDMSPLEKLAGGIQTGRLIGSGLAQAVKSIPTAITKGGKAAEEYIAENIYQPTQPKAYEYAGDVADFLTSLETDYKLPPVLPEAVAIQSLLGPATRQAGKAVKKGAKQGALNLMAPRTLNPQAGVIKPKGGNWLGGRLMGNIDENIKRLKPIKDVDKRIEAAEAQLASMINAGGYGENTLKSQQDVIDIYRQQQAVNNWVTSNLGKYVKNQMATPEDPIRLLLDKRTKEIEAKHAKDLERAERVAQRAMDEPDPRRQANLIRESERLKIEANVERQFAMDSIIPSRMQDYSPEADKYLKQRRVDAGFPAEGMGESEAAKRYETLTDDAISTMRAGDVQETKKILAQAQDAERAFKNKQLEVAKRFDEHIRNSDLSEDQIRVLNEKTPIADKADMIQDREYGELGYAYNKLRTDIRRDEFAAGQENPFIDKLDPETRLYSGNTADMGFDHVIDILRQDVASGRIRPEQLNKVSVEDAVRRTMEFDQEAARKMAEAQIKATEGFPVYKEYPEGYRWIELKKPEDLPEGYSLDEMGNVVDEKGHLTNHPGEKRLEEALKYEGDTMGHCVGGYCPDVLEGRSRIYSLRDAKGEPHVTVEVNPSSQRVAPRHEEIVSEMKASGLDLNQLDEPAYDAAYEQALQRVKQNRPPAIVQIKGKQNAAPKEAYLPYVQDFVRSGQWSEVGDLRNTGLIRKSDLIDKFSPDELDLIGDGEYLTKGEHDDLLLKALNARSPGLTDELGLATPPVDGMAHGGRVHFSDNPDVMQLELQAGGLVKGLKAAAKAVKAEKEAAVPLTLPRVRPTTKEILEAAERVGKQQAGEFVRSPLLKDTTNLAGRSKKEVDRLKNVQYKLTPIKDLPEMKPYEAKIGDVNIALPGDQTVSDMLLESVDGVPIGVTSEGGALFGRGRLADPEDKRAFWASNVGPAGAFQRKVTELARLYDTDMVTAYHLAMGQTANNFAQHLAEANMRAIDFSKLDKKKMDLFDREIAEGFLDKKDKVTGEKTYVTFPEWMGIASPEEALAAMKENPELRKWFNDRMKTEKSTKKSDLPYGKSIEWAMTEPELRNMEINLTGLSAGRMKPGAELIPDSAHQTYSHDIPGTALGRAPELSPFSISFPDATAFVREKYRPQDFTGTIQKVFPHQVVDEAYLEDMYKYYTQLRKVRGFKKGGSVQNKEVQGSAPSQKNNEQRVQNPVHFTENPDVMRLALSKRN